MNYFNRFLGKLVLVGVITLLLFDITNAASLKDLMQKQNQIQNQQNENNQRLKQKQQEGKTLKQNIEGLEQNISNTQNEIIIKQREISTTKEKLNELGLQINDQEQILALKNQNIRTLYISLYEQGQTSTLENILNSGSLSEYALRNTYMQSVKDKLTKETFEITQIKNELESTKQLQSDKKKDLSDSIAKLDQDVNNLDAQKDEKAKLLQITKGQETQYQTILQKLQLDKESLDTAIYQARAKQLGSKEVQSSGNNGYPWANEPNPSAVDPWLFYKRQCVSYTAWRWQATFGKTFYNTRPGNGNGWNWPALARDQGYQTSSVARVDSIVSWPITKNAPYGHTAWVTAVNNDGTINIAEYNWGFQRNYGERKNVDPTRYGQATYIFP